LRTSASTSTTTSYPRFAIAMVVYMTSDYLERIQDPLKLKLSGHVRAARQSACASASRYADDHPKPPVVSQVESLLISITTTCNG
jgi:hypothetical protein